MRSKLKFLLLLLLTTQPAFAQPAKLNPSLQREILNDPQSARMVSLLVKGDVFLIEKHTRLLGGIYKYAVSDVASVSLRLEQVYAFATLHGVERVEGLYGTGKLLDDQTLINANVNPVHLGYAPLTQAYDGNDVVIAFLDDGIDFNHPDFQNADGTTRILSIWDQTAISGGTTPQPYNYGQEWDSSVINSGTCSYYETGINYGHGSHVAGIATGNGMAVNNFEGVAPKSDIISVNVALDENFLNNIVDATEYSFNKAAALGKPCVINASIGTYYGSHDGYDLAAQLINDLITQQNGRSFVCAAGNAGAIPFHLGYETQPDSSFTWFSFTNAIGKIFYEWWIDKDDAPDFQFAFGADDPYSWQSHGRTKYFNLVSDFNYVNNAATLTDTLLYNGDQIGIVTLSAFRFDSTYACDVSITQLSPLTDWWRFITNGSGRFDLWSAFGVTGTSEMITEPYLPDVYTFPDIERYMKPDVSETTVSSFSCSDKVITVGNYVNRDVYIDYYNNPQTFIEVPGSIAFSSSLGPTRDGRIKPEITAPGDVTLSCGLLYLMDDFIVSQPYKVAPGGMHYKNGGTSMASPVVAGIVALLLQKKPNASWKEIKDAIQLSAIADDFTGTDLPDNTWGYGKVNAFDAMLTSVVYGCTNPFSINFNPLATVDDESCVPVIFGCTDVSALNYNASANMNDGSCQYNVGINEPLTENIFTCFPNPAADFTTFFFQPVQPQTVNSSIVVTDLRGKMIEKIKISARQNHLVYNHMLPSGIYFCSLLTGNRNEIIKLMVR